MERGALTRTMECLSIFERAPECGGMNGLKLVLRYQSHTSYPDHISPYLAPSFVAYVQCEQLRRTGLHCYAGAFRYRVPVYQNLRMCLGIDPRPYQSAYSNALAFFNDGGTYNLSRGQPPGAMGSCLLRSHKA